MKPIEQIKEKIQQSDMVLIGVGDEFTEKKGKNTKEEILQAVESLGKGAGVRGEALSLEECAALSNALNEKK